ncbi:putative F-box/FBD/LRR-repeat protein At4g03220 [Lolium perenne]|uniref:putative F-box/FBD/LRR-repeat protein At4g03220 n=1 Tax=Lolium perenne TaxID=4522 RepID=UPI003A996A2A
MEGQGEAPNQRAALPLIAAPDAAPTVPGGRSDYFGRLPDHLLLRILLKVGTKQAVKMGGVSRQWRRVWTQLPVLESDGVDSSVPARALAAYQAHGEDDIHSLNVSPNQVDGEQTTAWLSLAAPLLSGVLYLDNSHTVSRETLQLFLHDAEEAVMRRGAFELPCFKKAAVIRMDLGFLGIALPPAGVFHALRVMRLEHFWFRGQLTLIDTMLPSLRDLFIRRVHGLTILMLSSKSLLDFHLCLLPELRRLNILAPRLEELEVTGCFYVPESVARIAAERLEILKWEVPCVPEFGEMPHLRELRVPPITTDWSSIVGSGYATGGFDF